MLALVVVVTALIAARHVQGDGSHQGVKRRKLWQYVPWFIWGFIGLAALKASGWVPTLDFHPHSGEGFSLELNDALPMCAKWLLALSMAAIGLKPMLRTGSRAFLAGTLGWLAMSAFAFAIFYWLDI